VVLPGGIQSGAVLSGAIQPGAVWSSAIQAVATRSFAARFPAIRSAPARACRARPMRGWIAGDGALEARQAAGLAAEPPKRNLKLNLKLT